MDSDAGGWLWLVIDVAFVALFAAGLLYGVVIVAEPTAQSCP